MRKAEIALELGEAKMKMAQDRLQAAESLVAKGSAPIMELNEARLIFAQASAEVRLAKVQMDQIAQEADAGVNAEGPDGAGSRADAAAIQALQTELAKRDDELRQLREQVSNAAHQAKDPVAKPSGRPK